MRQVAIIGHRLAVVDDGGGKTKWVYDIVCFRNPPNRCQPDCAAFNVHEMIPGTLGVYCCAMFTNNPIGEYVSVDHATLQGE